MNTKYTYLRSLAIAFAALAAFVGIVMLINFIQLQKNPPVDNPAMKALIEHFANDTDNEALQQQIRALDLMARKAFFTAHWQIKSGTTLLVLFVFLSLASLHFYSTKTKALTLPGEMQKDDNRKAQKAQNMIYLSAVGFVIIVFAIAFLTQKNMDTQVENARVKQEVQKELIVEEKVETIKRVVVANDEVATEVKVEEMKPALVEEKKVEAQSSNDHKADRSASPAPKAETPAKASPKQAVANVVKAPSSTATNMNNSPYFRGPKTNGIYPQKNIPTLWDIDAGTNVKWKVKIPKQGYNSPVIWGHKIFLSGADATAREVYCYDLSSGKLLWTAKADNIPGSPTKMPETTEDTGLAAATVTTNGKHVIAIFATGDIIALDLSGNRVWARNLGVPDNHYGHASSLLNDGQNVFVQFDDAKNPRVMAFEMASGNPVWETHRDVSISWASPIMVHTGQGDEIILVSDPSVAAYNPTNGEELWKIDCITGEVGSSCTFADGMVFAANEYSSMVALKIENKTAEIVWEKDEYLPEASSLLAVNGLLYVCTSYGTVAVHHTTDGKMLKELEFDDGFYSSPVYADGKVFMLDLGGKMHILKADESCELIAEPSIPEAACATPVFIEGHILLRGKDNLYLIGH